MKAAFVPLPTSTHRHVPAESKGTSLVLFVSAFLLSCLTTIVPVVVIAARRPSYSIPSWVDERDDARCLRVSRTGDYVFVRLPIGHPRRVLNLVLRGDALTDGESSMTLFADELLRSETLRCENAVCRDAALLVHDRTGAQRVYQAEFVYGSYLDSEFSTDRQIGAEGRLFFAKDFFYELTATHVCWVESPAPANVSSGLQLSHDGRFVEDFGGFDAPATVCANASHVDFWPSAGHIEQTFLALSSAYLYEAASSKLAQRREVVERGIECGDESQAFAIYKLDCSLDVLSMCRMDPSLPFRRFSQQSIRFDAVQSPPVVGLTHERSLAALDDDTTFFFALMRLVVLLIVAFVVYSRAERDTSSAVFVVTTAFSIASGQERHGFHGVFNTIADASIGLLAWAARLVVLVVQFDTLVSDQNTPTAVAEIIGVFASGTHFALRHFVVKTDLRFESPLTKLGGSMAILDASVAALVSVTESPLLGSPATDFGGISRLVSGVLISYFVLQRMWVSTSSCALLAATDGFDRSYVVVLFISVVLWLLQSYSVGVVLGSLFVLPQASQLVRASVGGVSTSALAVGLGTLSLAFVPLNSTVKRLYVK